MTTLNESLLHATKAAKGIETLIIRLSEDLYNDGTKFTHHNNNVAVSASIFPKKSTEKGFLRIEDADHEKLRVKTIKEIEEFEEKWRKWLEIYFDLPKFLTAEVIGSKKGYSKFYRHQSVYTLHPQMLDGLLVEEEEKEAAAEGAGEIEKAEVERNLVLLKITDKLPARL
jgi:hypothetical protein